MYFKLKNHLYIITNLVNIVENLDHFQTLKLDTSRILTLIDVYWWFDMILSTTNRTNYKSDLIKFSAVDITIYIRITLIVIIKIMIDRPIIRIITIHNKL
jgi:hypothetical protein